MIEKIGQKMVEPLLDGLFSFFQNWIVSVLDTLLTYFTKDFAPDMGKFIEYLGSDNVASIQNVLMYTGIGLASVIFLFNIFMHSFPQLREDRDSLATAFIRYIIALLLVGSGVAFLEEWILSTAMFVYNWIGEITIDTTNIFELGSSYISTVVDSLVLNAEIPGISILLAILSIIFAITIIVNFFKFALEVVERYVVMCFLVLCFPVAASCYASSGTKRIFSAYWRMLISEIIVLVLNKLFIVGFLAMAGTAKVLSTGVLGFAFVIAYLRLAQRADGLLKSIGLNTVQTGGSLLDEAKGAMATGIMTARIASAGMTAIGGVAGGSMQSAGVKSGNFEKFANGQKLSNVGHNKSHSDGQTLKDYVAAGGTLNPEEDYAREAAARAAMTSGYKDLSSMSQKMQEAVIKQTYGDSLTDLATRSGFENASFSDVTVGANGDIHAKMTYGDNREMPVSLTKNPPRDAISNIGSVTDIAGNQMYLSRAESTNDIINKARQEGTLNASNPDVMDAATQMVQTNGLSGLKNMPSDVQSKAFTATHGAGFNEMAKNTGLGITADDIHNLSVDNSGKAHGTASIAGRDMNIEISPTQPADSNSLVGAYADKDGRMQFVTATPMQRNFDDIEYDTKDNRMPGTPVHSEPSASAGQAPGSINTATSATGQPGTPVHGEPSATGQPNAPVNATPSAAGQPNAPVNATPSAAGQPNAPVNATSSTTGQPGTPVHGEPSPAGQSGTPVNATPSAAGQPGTPVHGEPSPAGQPGTPVNATPSAAGQPGTPVHGEPSPAGQPNAPVNATPSATGQPGTPVHGEPSPAGQSGTPVNATPSAAGQPGTPVHGEPSPAGQSGTPVNATPSAAGQPGTSVHGEPSPAGQPNAPVNATPFAAGQPNAPVNATSSTTGQPGTPAHGEPTASAGQSSSKTYDDLSYTDFMMQEEGFDELLGTPPVSDGSGSSKDSTYNATPPNSNTVLNQGQGGNQTPPVMPSPSPSSDARRSFLQTKKSAAEIASGVTLDRGWKSANSIHLEGSRFTSTSNGGVELRNYDNDVMMYQDPKGFQHYSFGTKTPNEADFTAGGTYESSGYRNVKITGRFPDGSFTFEADGFDKKGDAARSKYVAQDYAKNHDQPGRVIQGNRIHQSLLVREVNAKKDLFGKGSER